MWHSAKMKPKALREVGVWSGAIVAMYSMRAVSKKRRNSTLFMCCIASRSPKRTRWVMEKRAGVVRGRWSVVIRTRAPSTEHRAPGSPGPLRHLNARHCLDQEPEERRRRHDDRDADDHVRRARRNQRHQRDDQDQEAQQCLQPEHRP